MLHFFTSILKGLLGCRSNVRPSPADTRFTLYDTEGEPFLDEKEQFFPNGYGQQAPELNLRPPSRALRSTRRTPLPWAQQCPPGQPPGPSVHNRLDANLSKLLRKNIGPFAFGDAGRCESKPVRFFGGWVYAAPNMDADKSDDLFPNLRNPEGTQIINDRCMVKTQDGHCLVIVSGIVRSIMRRRIDG